MALFNPTRGQRIRKTIANCVLGLAIIAVGLGYLGNYLPFIPWTNFTLFFPGWGGLFLIVPAVYFFIRRPSSIFWPICFLIGVLIILAQQEKYSLGSAAAIILAVAIIFVGIRIMLAPLFRKAKLKKRQKSFVSLKDGYNNSGEYSVRFGERTVDMSGQTFVAATLSTTFGQMNFDLRGALIEDQSVLDIRNSFGETDVFLPDYVKVEFNPMSAFGEVRNAHTNATDPAAPTIYINADNSFGEITIR